MPLSASISTMSHSRLFPPSPQNSLLPHSSYVNRCLPLRVPRLHHHHHHHHHHLKLLPCPHPWRNTILPTSYSCGCTSSSFDSHPDESKEVEGEEREVRQVILDILKESRVSEEDSLLIASNSPKYSKMLRDSVRELDELSLWSSWMKEKKIMEDEMTPMPFKEKVKLIAKEKGDYGKIPYLESIGLSLSSSTHLARLLSSLSLPSLIHKVKFVKEIFFSGSDDETIVGKLARRMMLHLSISVDDDVQRTLSFFEKIEARRGGLNMLGSFDTSFRHLIESFPRLLLLSVESNMKPMVKFLEDIGVPRQRLGNVLLLFPPLLLLDTKEDVRARLRTFEKVGALDKEFGRMLVKYPWLLSKSIQENYEEILAFLDVEKVPKPSIDRAIRDWPLLLGCSTDKLKPMLEQFDKLGMRSTKLGKLITTSPQLLLRRVEEFQKVVCFLQDLGFDKESVGGILARCPEIFAMSTEKTLQKKVEFLKCLGLSRQQLQRVVKKYPEVFVLDVDRTVMPRLKYLMESGLSKREIVSMVGCYSPLLGYSIEEVLKPKLEFLVNTMNKPVKEVVEYPRYFSYSLEKKIKPRFFVLKGRNVNCSLKDMLAKNDEDFATDYLGIERMFISIR